MRNYLLIFLIIVPLYSCIKGTDPICGGGINHITINSCMNEYLFDIGSFWVYQNSSNQEMDSVYVDDWFHSNSLINSSTIDLCPNLINTERVRIRYISTHSGTFSEYIFESLISESESENDMLFSCDGPSIESIEVNQTTYYNVVEMDLGDKILYYKDGIGVVRRIEFTDTDTTTYDLIEYDVDLFPNPE